MKTYHVKGWLELEFEVEVEAEHAEQAEEVVMEMHPDGFIKTEEIFRGITFVEEE